MNATLKASDSSTFEPKLTAIPDARNSAFSGNRLICIINAGNGEYRYRVYDKQPDGSWGEGVPVYEDEEGTIEFPTKTYSSILRTGADVGISGDYIVIAADNGNNNNSTYFIKRARIPENGIARMDEFKDMDTASASVKIFSEWKSCIHRKLCQSLLHISHR